MFAVLLAAAVVGQRPDVPLAPPNQDRYPSDLVHGSGHDLHAALVWVDPASPTDMKLRYTRSLDNGRTWSTQILDTALQMGTPIVRVDGAVVFVAWNQAAQGGGRARVSTDGGATFGPIESLPGIEAAAIANGAIHVAYHGVQAWYLSRPFQGVWSTPRAVSTLSSGGVVGLAMAVAATPVGPEVGVLLRRQGGFSLPSVELMRMPAGGSSFGSAFQQLNVQVQSEVLPQLLTSVDPSGVVEFHCLMEVLPNPNGSLGREVWYRRVRQGVAGNAVLVDGGALSSRLFSGSPSFTVSLSASGSSIVHVVYQYTSSQIGTVTDIGYRAVVNDVLGPFNDVLGPFVRVDVGDAALAHNSRQVRIARDGDLVAIAWADDRGGTTDLYGNRFFGQASAAALLPAAVRLTDTPVVAPGVAFLEHLLVSHRDVFVGWADVGSLSPKLHFCRQVAGHQYQGPTWPGFLPAAPTVDGTGYAAPGRTARFSASWAPTATAVIAAWFLDFSVRTGPALAQCGSAFEETVTTSATTLAGWGLTTLGQADLAVVVPANPALLGLQGFAQLHVVPDSFFATLDRCSQGYSEAIDTFVTDF